VLANGAQWHLIIIPIVFILWTAVLCVVELYKHNNKYNIQWKTDFILLPKIPCAAHPITAFQLPPLVDIRPVGVLLAMKTQLFSLTVVHYVFNLVRYVYNFPK
jgi:hypothetical protein